jgi:fluoroquinolone resistance protein
MDDLFSPRGLSGRTLTRTDLAPLAGGTPQTVTDCDL